ncbi:NAD(P)-dependent oxidoreductase [Paraburkholderia sp. MMS20-SJTN17]|uniref:NAD(P)-dependent oxidoreductase n=1 Tax=Paraburkholderia translucens TaxID=2886945 RepID=A0ABS8K9R9_9BURK|nr:NAD(P)-dependent oxidoreductase [Paraburkholderia sp. MMS20-SJTN17]MCC8401417.1 NAD(P)-dependent oxidoreductase [Paraburkholderia sp. MMS20-SJTN17]
MAILVTGGCGFLGSTLMHMIAQGGRVAVSLDRRAAATDTARGVHYVQGDLNDLPQLLETIDRFEIDAIIHTAAISHPFFSREIPWQTVVTNALGTTNVFEAARLKSVRRVVNFSSECVYGNNDHLEVTREDAPLDPTTPYGATKVFTEKLAAVYSGLYGMQIVSLRPGWIYGPGQFMQCYLHTLLRNAIDGRPTHEPAGADYRFQYVHVTDVARASLLALAAPHAAGGAFNITGGDQRSYAEVAALVRKRFPEAQIEIGPGTIDVLDRNAPFDLSLAKRELGYAPQVGLEEGIDSYAQWLSTHAC